MLDATLATPTAAQPTFRHVTEIESPLLCRKDAARYLGIAPQTLAQWACSGRYPLPYITIGRRAMYRRTALDQFIAQNEHMDGIA